ncbi:MAG: cysteine-rich CWC family protein [Nitrospirales bacterium]
MRGPVNKTCEHCRHIFECGGYRCWCGKVGITEQQMDWIAARFQDCLCPACLKLVSAGVLEGFPITPVSPTDVE